MLPALDNEQADHLTITNGDCYTQSPEESLPNVNITPKVALLSRPVRITKAIGNTVK